MCLSLKSFSYIRDELVVSNERLIIIILNTLPEEKCATIKVQSVRDSDLGFQEI